MKRRILLNISLLSITWLVCASGDLTAQNRRIRTVDDLFSAYEQVRGVGYISISPNLLKLAQSADATELDEVFNSIASLKILNIDIRPESEHLANQVRKDVQDLVKQGSFEEIVKMKEDESDFVIYLSQNKNKNSNELEALLLMANQKDELVLIGISGKITHAVIDAVMGGKIGILPKTSK
ncbi:MAG: DUF4252 domain-containing protein [Bacteroidales bacterium]|nr:DUF4252 domain-containing protein [Bacteroidales bacterium]MCL2738582.1 DUF4252 domain-containing protein [Bacteroidales bacterium]